jgi:hypothetical protein
MVIASIRTQSRKTTITYIFNRFIFFSKTICWIFYLLLYILQLNIETYHFANAICLWLCIPRDGTLLRFCDFLLIGIILHLLRGNLLLWNQSHYLLITRRTDVNFLFIQQAFTFFFFMCIILFQKVFFFIIAYLLESCPSVCFLDFRSGVVKWNFSSEKDTCIYIHLVKTVIMIS